MVQTVLVTTNPALMRSEKLTFQTGAAIQNAELIQAIADGGALFDQIHFITPDAAEFLRRLEGSARARCLRLIDLHEIAGVAAGYERGVLYMNLARGAYIRRSFCRRSLPIVFQGYSASYSAYSIDIFLDLISDLRPYDCVIAQSRTHAEATRRLYERTAEECAPLLRGLGPHSLPRIEIIPGGVDAGRFQPGDRAAARAAIGLPQDAVVLLSLSRITISDKLDPQPMLRAFHRTFADRPEVLLVIAGEGKNNNHLEISRGLVGKLGIPEDRVRFVSGHKISDVYQASDIFVFPAETPTEAFPTTPLEAMATGLPVVASSWDGLRDSVVDGRTGFLAPTLWGEGQRHAETIRPLAPAHYAHIFLGQTVAVDMDAFFQHVRTLVERPELRRSMGEAGRRRVDEMYAWPRLIPRYEALFSELMERSAADPTPAAGPRWRGLDFFRPHYFHLFQGYATDLLNPETVLELTAEGRGVADGRIPIQAYGPVLSVVDQEAIPGLFEALRRPCPLSRLIDVAPLPEEDLRFHVLWLLKHGYVRKSEGKEVMSDAAYPDREIAGL